MLAKEVLESREKTFQSYNYEEIKRKRAEGFVQLRKENRTQHTQKRRAVLAGIVSVPPSLGSLPPHTPEKPIIEVPETLLSILPALRIAGMNYVAMVAILSDFLNTREMLYETRVLALETLKAILSTGEERYMLEAVNHEVAPILIKNLHSDDEHFVFESCWCLTNLTASSHLITKRVVKAGFVEAALKLLDHSNAGIVDQIVWTLSNIAGDTIKYRDRLIEAGLVPKLLDLTRSPMREELLANVVWAFSNLNRGQPPPSMSVKSAALSIVPLVFALNSRDDSLLYDTCCLLESVTFSGDKELIDHVYGLDVHHPLLHLIRSESSSKVLLASLKVVGNLLLGRDDIVDCLLDCGLLDTFHSLLVTSLNPFVQKEVVWALSNIAAGTESQMQRLLEHRVFGKMIEHGRACDCNIRKEVIVTLANLTAKFHLEATRKLLAVNTLEVFLDAFEEKDTSLVQYALEGLDHLLSYCFSQASLESVARRTFEDLSGVSRLERLQGHQSPAVYKKVVAIMDTLYGLKEPLPDERGGPQFEFS